MTNRGKLAVASIAVAFASVIAVPALFAGRHGGKMMGGLHHRMEGFHALHGQLNLTDAQKEAMHQIFDRAREQNAGVKKSLHAGLVNTVQVLAQDPSNVAGARAALDRQETTTDQLKTNLIASASEAMKVLTPEQRQKLSGWIAEKAADHN